MPELHELVPGALFRHRGEIHEKLGDQKGPRGEFLCCWAHPVARVDEDHTVHVYPQRREEQRWGYNASVAPVRLTCLRTDRDDAPLRRAVLEAVAAAGPGANLGNVLGELRDKFSALLEEYRDALE